MTVLAYNNCSETDSPSEVLNAASVSCEDEQAHPMKVTSYGPFDPATMSMCHSYTGSAPRWVGMASVGSIALPMSMFGGGTACGTCFAIKGPAGRAIARVDLSCPTCAADTFDLDQTTFDIVTSGNGAGKFPVELTAIPCTVRGGLRFSMNGGTNSYYLNLSPSNYRHPVDSVEVNYGSGFVAMARAANSNDFSLSVGTPIPSSIQIKTTDIFGQTIQSSIDPSPAAETNTAKQFGDCK